MKPIVITLPLPSRTLNPNGRKHWAVKARAVKEYRLAACNAATEAANWNRPLWEKAAVQATFYFRDKRKRDESNFNAALKSAIDGLQDAGIVVDDSGITLLPAVLKADKENPRVVIHVTKIHTAPSLTAAPHTVTRRICSKCGLPMSRSIHPTRVVCTPCGRSVDVGVAEAKQYPWE